MGRYVDVSQVRAVCGITTKFISDADFEQLINSSEYEVERKLNVNFTPTTLIEQAEGDGSERLVLRRNPVLKLRTLNIDGTSVTPEYTRIDKQPGILWLTTSAEQSYFKTKATERNLTRVKYDYGWLEPTVTQTTSSAATIAGDSVTITVASSAGFVADDYIEVEGMDSQRETCKISSIPTITSITVDNFSLPHEADSMVTLQQVPDVAERAMRVGCALMAVARVVGQSFDEITGYNLGDMHVQKGEPYTQWRETAVQLRAEWKEMKDSVRVRPTIL